MKYCLKESCFLKYIMKLTIKIGKALYIAYNYHSDILAIGGYKNGD